MPEDANVLACLSVDVAVLHTLRWVAGAGSGSGRCNTVKLFLSGTEQAPCQLAATGINRCRFNRLPHLPARRLTLPATPGVATGAPIPCSAPAGVHQYQAMYQAMPVPLVAPRSATAMICFARSTSLIPRFIAAERIAA